MNVINKTKKISKVDKKDVTKRLRHIHKVRIANNTLNPEADKSPFSDLLHNKNVLSNVKLMEYGIKVPRIVSNKTRVLGFKDSKTLNIVVTNLISCLTKGSKLIYSRHNEVAKASDATTVYRVKKVVSFLEEKGYVTSTIGTASRDEDKRTISVLSYTDLFVDTFCDVDSQDQVKQINKKKPKTVKSKIVQACEESYIENFETFVIRCGNKQSVEFKKTKEIKEMMDFVKQLNITNNKHEILNDLGEPMNNLYCRVFNDSIEYGGRFYRAEVLSLSQKDRKRRLGLTIDGSPVVEVDYSSLHFRICTSWMGFEYDDVDVLQECVYTAIIEDKNNKVDRSLVKRAVNVMYNCSSKRQAYGVMDGVIANLDKEKEAPFRNFKDGKEVVDHVYASYPAMQRFFCKKEPFGMLLQNADSMLAADVLKVFVEQDKPILCVHDSFVVKQEDEELLVNTMGDKFRERFKVDWPVHMKISFLVGNKDVDFDIIG